MTDDQKNDMPTPEEAAASGLPLEEAEERGTEPAPEAAPSEEGTPAPEEAPQASSPPVEEEEQPAPPQPAEAPVPDVQEPDLPRQEAPAEAQQPAQPVPPPQPGYYGPYGRWAMDTACLPSRAGASRPIPRGCGSRPPGPRTRRGLCRPRGLPQGDSPPWGGIPCLPRAQPSPPPSRPGRKWAWG